jgi:hypothetical protein
MAEPKQPRYGEYLKKALGPEEYAAVMAQVVAQLNTQKPDDPAAAFDWAAGSTTPSPGFFGGNQLGPVVALPGAVKPANPLAGLLSAMAAGYQQRANKKRRDEMLEMIFKGSGTTPQP